MQLLINIDENLFTRLFDNGIELSEEDRKQMETSVRTGTPMWSIPEDEINPIGPLGIAVDSRFDKNVEGE